MSQPAILHEVRQELLAEAQNSHGLLTDLANLERYVAETYSARSFIELLQNADDANAQKVYFAKEGNWLLCANDGLPFSHDDFYSLCRSASSKKQRGQSIGYRGIGFKSVVDVADSIHLFSATLQATFSRDLTKQCLNIESAVPLVRIPHPLSIAPSDPVLLAVQRLEDTGYKTIFVLGGLNLDKIAEEFAQFDADYLIFLRHISEATLSFESVQNYFCKRIPISKSCVETRIKAPDRQSDWRVQSSDKCDIAFSMLDDKLVPLASASALVHAFLPTMESTGLGVRINADFSTDPSRTRIVFDDATLQCIEDAAFTVAKMVLDGISFENNANDGVLACLSPTVDLTTLAMQKRNFRTELISRLREHLLPIKEKISLAPAWLNATDAQKMSTSQGLPVISLASPVHSAQSMFLRYIGVQPLSSSAILAATEKIAFSLNGCAEVIAFCIRNQTLSNVKIQDLMSTPLWHGVAQENHASLLYLIQMKIPLCSEFISALLATGVSEVELQKALNKTLDNPTIKIILPNITSSELSSASTTIAVSPDSVMTSKMDTAYDPLLFQGVLDGQLNRANVQIITSQSLPAWRGAEQYVALALENYGYSTEDRSRQNLGYDIYAAKDTEKFHIEVKLIGYAGQPFSLTSNEEAVARESGDRYILALVLRDREGTHLQFIRHPTRTLSFVRQCRQWVWECSEYKFQSQIFEREPI